MAEETGAPAAINLKVLSPSTEVPGDINLPELPANTTVRELRLRIQDAIATRPATDRMRLIYRGHVIVNDTDTLTDVFGADNIRSSKDHTLHLVLRELPPRSTTSSPGAVPAPRSAAINVNPFRPNQTLPQAGIQQTNPFRASPLPRPNSQPQILHNHAHPHLHHHHHHHVPLRTQSPVQPTAPTPDAVPAALENLLGHNAPFGLPRSANGTPVPANLGQAPPVALPPGILPPGIIPGAGLPPIPTRTVRTETIGPNGQRVTVTWNNANIVIPAHPVQHPILPRPFPHPPAFFPPGRAPVVRPGAHVDQLLENARVGLQLARQEMENVRVLLQAPAAPNASQTESSPSFTPPLWRIDQIRHHMVNLSLAMAQVDEGLRSLTAEPTVAHHSEITTLREASDGLRRHAEELNAVLDQMRRNAVTSEAQASPGNALPTTTPSAGRVASSTAAPAPQTQSTQITDNTTAPDTRPELFLLSSPQGPVGILFDQRGTYTTAPMAPTLPFQAFTQQFTSNRQLLAGIGQQIVQNTQHAQNNLRIGQPQQNAQAAAANGQPAAAQLLNQNRNPFAGLLNPNPNQNQDQNQNGAAQAQNPAAEAQNDRLAIWAGHAWLIFKLACFVWFFAGNGGWYRPILLGLVAAAAYLFQMGLFERQLNAVRQHFEALLPLADRPGQVQGQNANANGQQGGGQAGARNGNITPEQAAQRLLQQHQEQRMGWVRESMRSVERAFALFVASLWPGVGERMVRAQEERARAERAAEEERRRLEEERRQQEAQEQEKKTDGKQPEQEGVEAGSSSKGKGKAKALEEVADTVADQVSSGPSGS